jgi:hypothetical protein
MKSETRGYIAHVEFGTERSTVICVVYFLGASKEYLGFEFFEVANTADQAFGIPGNRAATFQEELRTLKQAAAVAPKTLTETLYIKNDST